MGSEMAGFNGFRPFSPGLVVIVDCATGGKFRMGDSTGIAALMLFSAAAVNPKAGNYGQSGNPRL